VQVYRNGAVASAWGAGTSFNDTGLAANTLYAYTIEARDNNSGARGVWYNSTGPQSTNTAWTLSLPPASGSVTPDQNSPVVTSSVTWTAVGGFGAGTVQYYRYAWDTSPTHTWTGAEPQWSSGTLGTVPTSTGNWYLHVQGYNGADVANGNFDYAVNAVLAGSATVLGSSQNPAGQGSNVTFTATVSAVAPATGAPSGSVVFAANGVPFSTNALLSGSANASTALLPVGTNTVAAQYGGDSLFLSSADSLAQVIVSVSTCSQTNAIVGIADNHDGTFTITFAGTSQAQYYVVGTADITPPANWSPVAGSTNTVSAPSAMWTYTVTNIAAQMFYRSVAILPCP
jgi:hypothetical protein